MLKQEMLFKLLLKTKSRETVWRVVPILLFIKHHCMWMWQCHIPADFLTKKWQTSTCSCVHISNSIYCVVTKKRKKKIILTQNFLSKDFLINMILFCFLFFRSPSFCLLFLWCTPCYPSRWGTPSLPASSPARLIRSSSVWFHPTKLTAQSSWCGRSVFHITDNVL